MTTIETIYLTGAVLTGAIVFLLDRYNKLFVDEFSTVTQLDRFGMMITAAVAWPLTLLLLTLAIRIHIRFPGQWW